MTSALGRMPPTGARSERKRNEQDAHLRLAGKNATTSLRRRLARLHKAKTDDVRISSTDGLLSNMQTSAAGAVSGLLDYRSEDLRGRTSSRDSRVLACRKMTAGKRLNDSFACLSVSIRISLGRHAPVLCRVGQQ
jgi:hypothetical protein